MNAKRRSNKAAQRLANILQQEEVLAEQQPAPPRPDVSDVITDAMRSMPELLDQSKRDSRKIFEAFAEPFFGQESEFNYDEELTLP